ncbi:disease resistance protein At4g27190-like [Vitis riparia]|uniref:disease resistance protein At4g27190-like n=1 Tax=Vitis riparia TaxID=96939 RepID=UPI00155A523F|nr:disease resistance protein At4g27190-like [Vitis riparia]
MECVIACLSSAVSSFSEHLCGLICSRVGDPFTFKSNYSHLQQELQRLNDLNSRMERDHDKSVPGVNDWLRNVEETGCKVRPMQAKIEANKERCCGGFTNLFLQSREVAEALKEVRGLEERGNCLANLLAANRQARAVEHKPVESFDRQPAASKNLATIMNLLNDDAVGTIGVWGQGGIGKTTLVKNLNNILKDAPSTTPRFSIVIWITLSREWDLKSIQAQIAQRLKMEEKTKECPESLAARICERLKREQKFLLILDDVWKEIDLDALGIPRPDDQAACKIILTTRFLNVCRGMKTDREIAIHVLNDDEAWKLFCKNAGEAVIVEDIEPVAKAITKECGGLPLAISVMGTSMRKKTSKHLWEYALKELQRSVPHNIYGVEDKVYKPLKWSYDSLQGNLQSCFLYCSLYPEDFSIDISELVQCWLAEGLLDVDEQQSYEDIYNSGVALVENLKDCCLLENGDADRSCTVKMHDLVRDVAIWISSSLEDECKSLVQSGIGLSKFPESRLTPSLKRISFMRNELTRLPHIQIPCSEASTLLLQNNNTLERVPEAFLLGFQALRVLNLSDTDIHQLPPSLIHLGELRALFLSNCRWLNELPPVGRLSKLQVLDCSKSGILKLPEGMEQLSNLRELNLSGTEKLKTFRAGLISRLSGLEILDMRDSSYRWCLKTETNEGNAALLEELGCLERLIVLMVDFDGTTYPFSEYAPWMERLKSFGISVSGVGKRNPGVWSHYVERVSGMIKNNLFPDSFKNKDGKFEERKLLLSGLDLSGKLNEFLLTCAAVLELESCRGLNNLFHSVGGFVYLKSLSISSSNVRFKPPGGCRSPNDLLPNLEELNLISLPSLESISELVWSLGLKFSRLKVMRVLYCEKLKYLLSCDDFTQPLEKLEIIYLQDSGDLSDMFIYSSGLTSKSYPVAPNLRTIALSGLPKLNTLSRRKKTWLHLEHIYVRNCGSLKKLPLNKLSANTVKEIRGEIEWWTQLKWDDDVTSSSLQPLFKGPAWWFSEDNSERRVQTASSYGE